jgi:hypothetical protein
MKNSKHFEALAALANQLFEEGLSDEDTLKLQQLLIDNPSAQSDWVQLCEIHSMLESEPDIQSKLASAERPDNVLSLPGAKSPQSNNQTEETPKTSDFLSWALGIAVVIGLSLLAFALMLPITPDSTSVAQAAPPGAVEKPGEETSASPVDDAPEKQYQRAIVATLGSGSQQRPPTNFTSEPSLHSEELSFNRDIRPILSDNCFSCHGPDEASRKAELRLDTQDGFVGGESPTVVPGKPEESEMILRLTATDSDDLMPPAESHKELTPKEIILLTQWVEEGAVWEDHWSFMPITDQLPAEAEGHPVDHFIDQKLSRLGLSRSEQAPKQALIRRAYLDLTGLPPTPEEVAAFVKNESSTAYETLLDELLSRPTFGEHRARYWLDAARYGDTHGLHLDNYREIWPYRDWVINAFNENKPFDVFTVEQIAGDMMPNVTQDQRVATGFNRCNVTTSEGGAIAEEFLVRYAVDRVATTATVWMGLTAGCAQCHDHKFDPLTMKDFYSLFAFFNNTTQPGMDGNAKDSAPVIRVYKTSEQEAKANQLRAEVGKLKKDAEAFLKAASFGEVDPASVAPAFIDHGEAESPTLAGDEGHFSKSEAFTVAFRFKLPDTDGRLVLAEHTDKSLQEKGWRIVWEDRGIFVELIESYPNKILKRGVTRKFRPGSSGHFAVTYDGSGAGNGIALYSNGGFQSSRFVNEWHDSLVADFKAENAKLFVGGKNQTNGLTPVVNEFVVFDRELTDKEIMGLSTFSAVKGIAKKPADKRSDKEKPQLKQFLAMRSEGPYRAALLKLSKAETALSQIESVTPTTLVMNEKEEEPKAHLLLRGEYDQKADEVSPAFPAFFTELKGDFAKNRLGLAQWLVHPDHPLTARVSANRIWQELFGTGLVKTAEDFGTQGENPSHPELLDWLASSFIESGWNVKALYRNIMMSDTYRQQSTIKKEMVELDPENRLLARGPRFRLDAEVIRDQALAASGLIDSTVGGPSVKPYQPSGIWESVGYTNSNTQTFFQDFGPSAEHRRSVYSFWKRTAHPPSLAIMDAPNRESCVMRRERTNTPLQALVLMNDPQFVRASRYLALRVLSETPNQDDRLNRLAELLRSRPLDSDEVQILTNSLDQFRNTFESDPAAAQQLLVDEVNDGFSLNKMKEHPVPELAAWTMVASQILNLDESLNKN